MYQVVQYDEENGLTTWLDLFENKLPEISKETNALFNNITKGITNVNNLSSKKDFNRIFNRYKITESREDLEAFLKKWDGIGDISDAYQQWMVANGKSTFTFTSFTKKASTALKTFGAAMASMAVNWAIGKVIDFVATGIDKFGNASKHAAENAKDLASEMNTSVSSISSDASRLSDLNDEYQALSKGVNKLGENIGLSTEDYNRYKNIISQVSEIMPTLTTYFNAQGEKIAFARGQLKDLNEEHKKYLKNQAVDYVAKGDSDGNTIQDILDNYNNNKSFSIFENFWKYTKNAFGFFDISNFTTKEVISELEKLEQAKSIDEILEMLTPKSYKSVAITTNLKDHDTALKYTILDMLGLTGKNRDEIKAMTEEDYNALMQSIISYIQTYNAKIASDMNQVHAALFQEAYSKDAYWDLEDDFKNDIITFFSSIDGDIWDALNIKTANDFSAFVNKIIDFMVKNTNGFAEAWNNLFSLEPEELSPDEYAQKINDLLKTICNTLGLDEGNGVRILKIGLGFENVDDIVKNYNAITKKAAEKFSGVTSQTYGNNSEADLYYEQVLDDLDVFAKENSINTQDEIAFWNKCLEESDTRQEAMEKYLASPFAAKDPATFNDIFAFKSADDTLTTLGKISESIDTIQNAYKTLSSAIDEYNKNGVLSIDTVQSITELGSGYLDYLIDEEGNIRLDQEALQNLTLARLQDMRAQMQQELLRQVESIQDETDANNFAAQAYREKAAGIDTVTQALLEEKVAELNISDEGKNKVLSAAGKTLKQIDAMFDSAATGIFLDPNQFIGGFGSATSEFSETIDFFERRITVLDDALSHLKSTMDNVAGSFGKNNLLDAELGITEEKFHNYSDALSMYTQKANEAFAKIPADIAAKVKDGAVALNDFIGGGNQDVVEAIKDYESWAGKVSDCQQNLAELKKEIRQLELEKFNNTISDFSNQFDLRENSKDLISKQIDLLKEAGELIGESFYSKQIEQSQKQLHLLEAEKTSLVQQLNDALSSGHIRKGTDEWLKMVNALSDVDGNILDCKKSIEEFDNSILALHTEIFERIQSAFGNISDEISNLIGLMEDTPESANTKIPSNKRSKNHPLFTDENEIYSKKSSVNNG